MSLDQRSQTLWLRDRQWQRRRVGCAKRLIFSPPWRTSAKCRAASFLFTKGIARHGRYRQLGRHDCRVLSRKKHAFTRIRRQVSVTAAEDKCSAFSRQRQSLWLWKPLRCARGLVPRPLPSGVAIPPSFFRPTNIVRLLFGPGRFNLIVDRRFLLRGIRSVCLRGRR